MELRKYFRNRQGHPLGVLVSNSKNSVGWSLCAHSQEKHDRFNKEHGIEIARGREAKGVNIKDVPMSMRAEFEAMMKRSVRYFR